MTLPVAQPATWHRASSIAPQTIPESLRDFLFDPGSTTRRMQQEYGSSVEVNLIRQEWNHPHTSETQLLQMSLHQTALIREVYLNSQNKTWMYARTVFPKQFFTGNNSHLLQELDHRPLGKILFSDPTMQRSEYEITQLHPHHLEYQWATQKNTKENTSVPDGNPLKGWRGGEASINCDQAIYGVPQRQDPVSTQPQTGTAQTPTLWARRSIFQLHQNSLLLTEIFLPGFFDLTRATV